MRRRETHDARGWRACSPARRRRPGLRGRRATSTCRRAQKSSSGLRVSGRTRSGSSASSCWPEATCRARPSASMANSGTPNRTSSSSAVPATADVIAKDDCWVGHSARPHMTRVPVATGAAALPGGRHLIQDNHAPAGQGNADRGTIVERLHTRTKRPPRSASSRRFRRDRVEVIGSEPTASLRTNPSRVANCSPTPDTMPYVSETRRGRERPTRRSSGWPSTAGERSSRPTPTSERCSGT